MCFILTGEEKNDCTQALYFLDVFSSEAVLADKGYDADYRVHRKKYKFNGRYSAKIKPHCSTDMTSISIKMRDLIDSMFGKLKQFRRVATRYEEK